MTDDPGMSRRAFLRVRFGRESERHPDVTSSPPKGGDPRRPIMRYPTSTDDVDSGIGGAEPRTRRRRLIPVQRPPGAVDEPTFLDQCTRCDECLKACPHDAIVHAPPRLHEIAGTPIIESDHAPCRMCDDLPCIDVCEPNVLTREVPVMMGTARITEETCIAHRSMTCTVCIEQCPVEGAIVTESGKPHVVEDQCTGCGVCRYVCPAPENAILLMPTFTRPARPETDHRHG